MTTLVEPIKQMAETKMAGPPAAQAGAGGTVAAMVSAVVLVAVAVATAGLVVARRGRRRQLSSLPSSATVRSSN